MAAAKTSSRICAILLMASALPLWAADDVAVLDAKSARQLFNLRGCNACHEVDEARIGPPYKVVALRYAAAFEQAPEDRIAALAAKIRFGGAGAWGNVPMVSNPAISQVEAESIADWIMRLGSDAVPAKEK